MNASELQAEKARLTQWHAEQTAVLGQTVTNAQRRVADAQAALEAAKQYQVQVEKTAATEKDRITKHLTQQHAIIDRQITAITKPMPWPVKA